MCIEMSAICYVNDVGLVVPASADSEYIYGKLEWLVILFGVCLINDRKNLVVPDTIEN